MMVDFGADFLDFTADPPADPTFKVHWLVSNISNLDLNTGRDIIPHFGSNPFTRYVVSRMSDLGSKWVIWAPNGTNPDIFFQIIFSTFWLTEPKCTESDLKNLI